MKKIAIIAHGLGGGGAERVACLVANALAEKKYKVLFIAVYSSDRQYVLNKNVRYEYIDTTENNKLLKFAKRTSEIDKKIRQFNTDLAISFIINETLLTNIKSNVPIIYTLRIAPSRVAESKIDFLICRFLYSRAFKVVFQTKDARDYFSEKIKKKGVVIGNPITDNLPYWKDYQHKKHIISACRLTPQKNLKMMIKAYANFRKKYEEYKLVIYGKGPLLDELIKYADELCVSDYVEFPGHSNNIHRVMAEASIFALTSNYEGLSNSMLEALAIGVPTICTDCPPGGAAEYIEDGVNGMLVSINNDVELTNKLSLIAEDDELANVLSQNSVGIRNILSCDKIMEQWIDIINQD